MFGVSCHKLKDLEEAQVDSVKMMRITVRNLIAFPLATILLILVFSVTTSTLIHLHNRKHSIKYKISNFFKIWSTTCAIGLCCSSVAVCTSQALWLFFGYYHDLTLTYVILQHVVTMIIICIIFVGRLYYTFANTRYAFGDGLYIFLIIWFGVLIGTGIILTIIEFTTSLLSYQLYSIVFSAIGGIFILSNTLVVILFIQTMRRVKC